MTLEDLNPVLSTPKRLAAMGIVAAAKKVDFSFVRDQLELSDSDLSKQLKALTDAGYITTKKTGRGATRRTWVSTTDKGLTALNAHATALEALIRPTPSPPLATDATEPTERLTTPTAPTDS